MKRVLPNMIHSDQTGFLPGRYIGENIRLALDMIDYLNKNNLPGLMFLIDFHKAFDKIEWSFILKALNFFNFGPDLIKWVNIFYTDISSCVINNGHATSFFNLGCGVRQGCPLSPLLYIVCGEILSLLIKNDNDINGIMLNGNEITVSAYADDTTLYLRDANSLRKAILTLRSFQLCSGLAINLEKSELLALGYFHNNHPDIADTGLTFCLGHVKFLGVTFTTDLKNMEELNFIPKFEKLKSILRIWSMRDMTPMGRITIVKTLGLSQLIYLLSVLPKPSNEFLKDLDTVLYKFIWANKPDKVSRKTIVGDYQDGGLKMMHIPSMIKGLKIAWVKRLLDDNNKGNWKCFYEKHLEPFGGNFIWHCNINPDENCLKIINNNFIYEVVVSWFSVVYEPACLDYHKQIIWNNSDIKIANRMVFWKDWYDKGVKSFKDMLSDNGDILNLSQLKEKFQLNINFMNYFSLVYAIPQKWKCDVKMVDRDDSGDNFQNEFFLKLEETKKVCKLVHEICIHKLFKSPVSEIKWALQFEDWDLNWKDIYSIPFQSSLSIKLRYFQFKILHRYIAVNKLLAQIGIVNSDSCTFCKKETEDIQHCFWNCTEITPFWNQFQTHLLGSSLELTLKDVILGLLDFETSKFNFLILHAKYYIYICKMDESKPRYAVFVNFLKSCRETEKFIAVRNNRFNNWSNKWKNFNL